MVVPRKEKSGEKNNKTILLLLNFVMMMAWLIPLCMIVKDYYLQNNYHDHDLTESCGRWSRTVRIALVTVSTLELASTVTGYTSSPLAAVLLFGSVRCGVEFLAAPAASSCLHPAHVVTMLAWAVGDTIRFGCFVALSVSLAMTWPKHIRYNAGPLIFPIGATAEAWLVVHVAHHTERPILYAAAALWPVGFYPLYRQLLRQRQKFYRGISSTPTASKANGKAQIKFA